jgi:hypothetical protein
MHGFLQLVGCFGMARVGRHEREVIEPMPYFKSWEASRLFNRLQQMCQFDGEARRDGVMIVV